MPYLGLPAEQYNTGVWEPYGKGKGDHSCSGSLKPACSCLEWHLEKIIGHLLRSIGVKARPALALSLLFDLDTVLTMCNRIWKSRRTTNLQTTEVRMKNILIVGVVVYIILLILSL